MAKNKGITFALLLVLLLHIDAFAISGVLSKSFYVPVEKGEYVEADEAEEAEEPATPTNVLVIVSAPIQIVAEDEEMPVQENEEVEEIEAEDPEVPQLEEEIE